MRILVVDDDEVFRNEFSEWLTSEGHETELAGTGSAAILLAKNQAFDVAFMDMKMPCMNGMEAIRALKVQRSKLHVIMVTAYGTIDTAVEAMKSGAEDYLCKPLDIDYVRQFLRDMAKTVDFEMQLENARVSEELNHEDPFVLFKSLARNVQGLCITRQDPASMRDRYGLQDVYILHLTTNEDSDSCIHPRNVYDLEARIESFYKKHQDGVVLFDGLETLMEQHPWEALMEFFDDLSSNIVREDSKFIITLNPDCTKTSSFTELKYLVGRKAIQLISESLANPIRRLIIRFVNDRTPSRFSDILKGIRSKDAPKLSFHLKKLLQDGILRKDGERRYSITGRGKNVVWCLAKLENEVICDLPSSNILLIERRT